MFCLGNRFDDAVPRHGRDGLSHGYVYPAKKFRRSGMRPVLQRSVQQDDEGAQVCENEAKLLRSQPGEFFVALLQNGPALRGWKDTL